MLPSFGTPNDGTQNDFDGEIQASPVAYNNCHQVGSKSTFFNYVSREDMEMFIEKARNFTPIEYYDDHRAAGAHPNGGFPLDDQEVVQNFRNAIKSVISQVGRSILSGKFNLASVSFPIWCMAPNSILQTISTVAQHISLHLRIAALTDDPVTRMKQTMVASFAYIYPGHNWLKPLNPILGETYQSYTTDGGLVFMEQICHHPPISYICFDGPQNLFRFHGYSNFAVKARWNNITLEVGGKKTVEFADGTEISF